MKRCMQLYWWDPSLAEQNKDLLVQIKAGWLIFYDVKQLPS